MRAQQAVWYIALAAVAAAILAATLHPVGAEAPVRPDPLCLLCGDRATADALLNVALFVPLGVVLALGLPGWLPALLAPAALSAAIELTQLAIPGRHTLLADLLANTLGGALGVAVVRLAPRWLRPSVRGADRLALAWSLAAAALLFATGWLLQPSFPSSTYFGQWTARLGHLSAYEGTVREARVGGTPVPSRRVPSSETLRQLLAASTPIEVTFLAGPPPEGLAPIFSIFDDRRREILLVGARGEDLVLRQRTRSAALRLDAPGLRAPGVFRSVAPGETVRLTVWRSAEAEALCARAAGYFWVCPLAHTPARGWALLRDSASRWGRLDLRSALDFMWLLALGLPVGFWLRRSAAGIAAALILPLAAVATPLAFPFVGLSLVALAGAFLGIALGVVGGRWLRRLTGGAPGHLGLFDWGRSRSARESSSRQRSIRL